MSSKKAIQSTSVKKKLDSSSSSASNLIHNEYYEAAECHRQLRSLRDKALSLEKVHKESDSLSI